MCGIIVDMTIINILIRNYFPKLIPLLENKNENYGDYIGNNFINVNLINLFTNEYLNENTSLLIWDLLFIDGNIILIRAFLAIYHYLIPFLLDSSESIEDFQIIINEHMKKLENDNKDLIFYLAIKDYNITEEVIEQARFSLSIDTSNSIKKGRINNPVKMNKKVECDLNWPACRYIYQNSDNNKNVIFCNVLQRKNKNYIENYFLEKSKDKKNIIISFCKEDKIKDENDLLIERNVHYCNKYNELVNNKIIEEKNRENENEEKNDKLNEDIKKEINYIKMIYKPEFIEASKKVLNNLKIKLKPEEENVNVNQNK